MGESVENGRVLSAEEGETPVRKMAPQRDALISGYLSSDGTFFRQKKNVRLPMAIPDSTAKPIH